MNFLSFVPPLTLALLAGMAVIAGCAGTPGPQQEAQPREPDVAVPATAPATLPTPTPAPARSVSVRIDEAMAHQVIEGFGATTNEYFDMVSREDLMGALRPRVIEAVYGQVGITMGQLEVGPYENFDPSRYTTANDDGDPLTFNWRAFNFVRSEGQKTGIVDLARPYGFDNFTIHSGTNVRWSDPWLAGVRKSNYRLYLEEMAENVVAPLIYWRDKFGIVTRWHHLFNEPTTGNGELAGGGVQEVVDLVKAVGARLRREGFGDLRMVVASEETEEASLASARAILADPEARRYVGAIGYHTYPYGSVYSDVNRILATSGQGGPDAGRIKVRNDIRDLAKQYGLQVWMTEVSNGRAGPLDSLRGRAIHIHDEMRYANASSYWAMYQVADMFSQHGPCGEDCLVHFNRVRGTVSISGTGYAIGHYARWIRRGAVRIDSETDDPLVLASAFRDDARKRIIAVVVNNHLDPVSVTVRTAGRVELSGEMKGEQSSAEGYWLPLTAAAPRADGSISTLLLPRSVTSLSVEFR
ncbi:MAG: hypothetical protein HY067_16690 [Betaproteobacteria bacterium]|nr:hypothetical protein [Betaproteobacteria bacterium]